MEIFSRSTAFSRQAREQEEPALSRTNWILWMAAILTLLGLNAFSWIFCLHVFGHPEEPFNYRLLTHPKINRLDPVHGFSPVTAPRGKFYSPREIYALQLEFKTADQLRIYNAFLKRRYLRNYVSQDPVNYLSGQFIVQTVTRLGGNGVFPSGLVVRAQSEDYPAAYVELVLPAETVPEESYQPGELMKIDASTTCAAVIHIERLAEDDLCITAVPLVQDTLTTNAGTEIAVNPPGRLNMRAPFPLTQPAPVVPRRIAGSEKPAPVAKPVVLQEDKENADS